MSAWRPDRFDLAANAGVWFPPACIGKGTHQREELLFGNFLVSAPSGDSSDIAATLGLDRGVRRGRTVRRVVIWLLVLGLLALAGMRAASRRMAQVPRYETQIVRKGDLIVSVNATGTLEPHKRVDVGSELSGIVRSVDVDFNDQVKAGQLLVRLDTGRLDAQAAQTAASLEAARARLQLSEAALKEAEAHNARIQKLFELSGGQLPTAVERDAAMGALERARADKAVSTAAISQWEATLSAYRTDLAKAEIRSPIDGIVLRRQVEPGQTVTATFQSPVLFTLVGDLRRLELMVDVDEADVGRVREGQTATFTVDAFPNRAFPAIIKQVRNGNLSRDGVVTYKTLLEVDNSEQILRPSMTATAVILVDKREGVLLVPNAALRFAPPEAPAKSQRSGLVGSLMPRAPPTDLRPPAEAEAAGGARRVYVLSGEKPEAVKVETGATDGMVTEIVSGDLREGMAVITDMVTGSP